MTAENENWPADNSSFVAAFFRLHVRAALDDATCQQVDVDYSDIGQDRAILIGHAPDMIYYADFQIARGEPLDRYRDYLARGEI
jgi:hypothetical protein